MLTDTGGDVNFIGWCSDVEMVLRYFCCLNYITAGQYETFVGSFACATTWVVFGSLSAIVDGIDPSIIPRCSSWSSTPRMYVLFVWGIVVSIVLAKLPFSCRRSNLRFHLSAILFWLGVCVTGVTLLTQIVTLRLASCSSTWHGGGDRQEYKFDDNRCLSSLCSALSLSSSMLIIPG